MKKSCENGVLSCMKGAAWGLCEKKRWKSCFFAAIKEKKAAGECYLPPAAVYVYTDTERDGTAQVKIISVAYKAIMYNVEICTKNFTAFTWKNYCYKYRQNIIYIKLSTVGKIFSSFFVCIC